MKYYNIQVLRALAAYSVVAHHLVNMLNSYIADVGSSLFAFHGGVDVFFVLSGFVMATLGEKSAPSPGAFFIDRLARIGPIYWLLTLVSAVLLMSGAHLFGRVGFSAHDLVASMAFLPIIDAHGGVTKPFLLVGWSLNFEMLFYLMFALSLMLKTQWQRNALVYGMIGLIFYGGLLLPEPHLRFYGQPYIVEFAAGLMVWQLTRSWTLPPLAAWAAAALSVAAFAAMEFLNLPEAAKVKIAEGLFIFPAALLVLAFVSLEQRGLSIRARWLQFQGDASYSIYLTHIFVIQIVGKVSIVAGLNKTPLGLAATLAATVAAIVVTGALFHRFVEKPLNAQARRLVKNTSRARLEPARA